MERTMNESSRNSNSRALGVYLEPYVVEPLQKPHKHTFIILHGRGSNGQLFGTTLLEHPIPEHGTLAQAFPHAKFVFPTAAFRRATVFKRKPITQWFDNWHLTEGREEEREELQWEGLKASCEFLHKLILQEAATVVGGLGNVVVGGLSQGCATMLVAMILWWQQVDEQQPQPAAWFGMCGWLPLRKRMSDVLLGWSGGVEVGEKEEDIIVFEDHMGEDEEKKSGPGQEENDRDRNRDPRQLVSAWLHEELEFQTPEEDQQQQQPSTCKTATRNTPLFLGLGLLDGKVPFTLGRDAKRFLDHIGVDLAYHEYERLGHWYSSDMLRNIVTFVQPELSSN